MSVKSKKIYIKTFGCVQNTADSERIKAFFWERKYEEVDNWKDANRVVINTCIIRESAENRAYGLIDLINKWNSKHNKNKIKIIVTGCLSGLAKRDRSGKKLNQLKRDFPTVDAFWPIEKFSEDLIPVRNNRKAALIPISTGCDNYCSYCIVPMARGKELSRNFDTILTEADQAILAGFKEVILIGQNVNSYGSDLNLPKSLPFEDQLTSDKGDLNFVHMGKKRFKSMFPKLLEEVAKKKFDKVSFVSSNPWDFSDDLIDIIAKYPNIDKLIHLPFQSGDDEVLKKMSRGYTKKEYLELIDRIKKKIPEVRLSTDIIVGFPGETEAAFQNTVDVCQKVGFEIAYINKYSPRVGTVSAKMYQNDIPMAEKKRRWEVLNDLVNN